MYREHYVTTRCGLKVLTYYFDQQFELFAGLRQCRTWYEEYFVEFGFERPLLTVLSLRLWVHKVWTNNSEINAKKKPKWLVRHSYGWTIVIRRFNDLFWNFWVLCARYIMSENLSLIIYFFLRFYWSDEFFLCTRITFEHFLATLVDPGERNISRKPLMGVRPTLYSI